MPGGLRGQLERARALGFLGPGPIDAHIDHAQGFVRALVDVDGLVIDLGSGGGVPGLVIAVARGDLRVVLVDAMDKRCRFLEQAVVALGFDHVDVLHQRAEEVGRGPLRGTADAVVARSFGPPAATAECAAPLLRAGGRLVVSEPPGATGARWPAAGTALLGLEPTQVLAGPPTLQVLEQRAPTLDRYPRRPGIPTKRPLF